MTTTHSGAAARLAALLAAACLLSTPACKRDHVAGTIEEPMRLASSVRMGDSTMANQLASGFYGIEAGAWRWTMQKFAVSLRPPAHSAQQGAVLELHFTIPQTNIDKLGSMTLTANVGGTPLAPETYSKAGAYTYRRDVPASLLGSDVVRVDFDLDKAMPPGDVDKRELGVVASSAALVKK